MTDPLHRYEIIGTLGTGASSRVDKARDSTIGRTVAVKTFLHSFDSGDLQKQFLREAQIIGRLTHPNIVNLYDVGTNADGVPYLVMEYVEGKTLQAALDAGRLALERAAVWAADLASALARAHQCKIIHGDVKPANVLITAEGQVKLGDFGIARFATQMSGSGTVLGTPAYLSPEQILGHKQDTRSDLFSLGIVLYQMTTGVRPFDGTSVDAVCAQIISAQPAPPSHHNPELPPEFDHVVMRCLAKNPAHRYSDAASLGASLYPFARSKPIPMAPSSPFWWKRPVQTSDLRVAAGVLIVLAAIGASARAWHQHKPVVANGSISRHNSSVSAGTASNTLEASSSALLINAGAADLRALAQPSDPHAMDSLPAQNASTDRSASGSADSMLPAAPAARTSARHAAASTTAKTMHSVPDVPDSASSPSARATGTTKSADATSATKSGVATASKTLLHVDVVSTVSDDTISVFAGDDLLLSTPLQAEHIGDTLRFDCPVTPGEHAFRVVLSRADESVIVEKSSTSQVRSDASNFLGVHVTRRAKMLVKHETALEVVWPSTVAPIAPSAAPRPGSELALR
ncbi:MAG: protein kinase [Candidatus Acidiferrum sp.]|jgi:serine/threonine protein kinase